MPTPNVFDELEDAFYMATPRVRMHRAPAGCAEAMLIWRLCKLGAVEPENIITLALEIWAEEQKLVYSKDGIKYVGWISPMGARYDMKQSTFARWMICACNPDTIG